MPCAPDVRDGLPAWIHTKDLAIRASVHGGTTRSDISWRYDPDPEAERGAQCRTSVLAWAPCLRCERCPGLWQALAALRNGSTRIGVGRSLRGRRAACSLLLSHGSRQSLPISLNNIPEYARVARAAHALAGRTPTLRIAPSQVQVLVLESCAARHNRQEQDRCSEHQSVYDQVVIPARRPRLLTHNHSPSTLFGGL